MQTYALSLGYSRTAYPFACKRTNQETSPRANPLRSGGTAANTAISIGCCPWQRAMAGRPKVGGFPYRAETLRQAGVTHNYWYLPSCQSLYLTGDGSITIVGAPLVSGMTDVPPFNREALVDAIRTDQAGESSFEEFLLASWKAGVVRYDVDFPNRVVCYYGASGEEYRETYPLVEL